MEDLDRVCLAYPTSHVGMLIPCSAAYGVGQLFSTSIL